MGIAILSLQYVSHTITGQTLRVVMKDISREVYVTLEYAADAETGILKRTAEIENRTQGPFTIEQVSAATWNLATRHGLPAALFDRDDGRRRTSVQERAVQPGKTVLESRRGTTGAQNHPVVRDRSHAAGGGPGERRRVVRGAGLERLVADHSGAGSVAAGAGLGRSEQL